MKKFNSLLTHIKSFVRNNDLDQVISDISFLLIMDGDETGYKMGEVTYRAELILERQKPDAQWFFSQLMYWAYKNGVKTSAEIDVDPIGNDLVDIYIEWELSDDIHIRPDANGPFDINGQHYGFGESEIWFATELGNIEGQSSG